jgi:predicted transcriptional regulator
MLKVINESRKFANSDITEEDTVNEYKINIPLKVLLMNIDSCYDFKYRHYHQLLSNYVNQLCENLKTKVLII